MNLPAAAVSYCYKQEPLGNMASECHHRRQTLHAAIPIEEGAVVRRSTGLNIPWAMPIPPHGGSRKTRVPQDSHTPCRTLSRDVLRECVPPANPSYRHNLSPEQSRTIGAQGPASISAAYLVRYRGHCGYGEVRAEAIGG